MGVFKLKKWQPKDRLGGPRGKNTLKSGGGKVGISNFFQKLHVKSPDLGGPV